MVGCGNYIFHSEKMHVAELRNNKTNLTHTSLSLHVTDVQCLDMFRALLAHPQEALHGRRIGGYCVQLYK
jgi:hypothetical protein